MTNDQQLKVEERLLNLQKQGANDDLVQAALLWFSNLPSETEMPEVSLTEDEQQIAFQWSQPVNGQSWFTDVRISRTKQGVEWANGTWSKGAEVGVYAVTGPQFTDALPDGLVECISAG